MTELPNSDASPDIDAPFGAGIDFTDPNGRLAPYYLRASHVVAAAFVALIFVAASAFPLWHTDVWGHLRYGQWMAEHRAIPDREPFCPWWDGRQPFTQFYTATQLAMYAAYAAGERIAGGDDLNRMAGGVEMLRAQHAFLTAARFAVLLFVFVRLGAAWPVALLGGVAHMLLDLSNLAVFRPQTFAQLQFAVLLLPLSRELISRRAMVFVPLWLVVWANGHGSFIVALAMIGVGAAGRAIELFLESQSLRRVFADAQVQRLALTWLASAAAIAFLNPYGPSLYKRTFDLSRHPSLVTAVGEWQPLGFEWKQGWHWIFMASILVVLATQFLARKPLRPAQLLALFVFGVGVALQNRFVIWWAMIVPFVLAPQWAELFDRAKARWNLPESVPSFRKTILAVCAGAAVFMWSGPGQWLTAREPLAVEKAISTGTPWNVARGVRGQAMPEGLELPGLADALKAYPGGKFRGSILATPMQGDFLMWALAPDIPVTYAHIHLFPPDFWDELGIIGQGRPGWWDILEKYQVNLLVVEAEYAPKLRDELQKTKGWTILLDETGDTAKKPEKLNRQLVVIRDKPL